MRRLFGSGMSRAAVIYTSLLLRCRGLLDRCLPDSVLSHIPGVLRARAGIRHFVTRRLIPAQSEWVRVQGGLAGGLWIHIDLANERTWWLGTHEPATQEALRKLLGPDKVMYDVGAHIGFYSLPAARLGTEVIAFEPDPENVARLRAHVDRNGLGKKVLAVEAAAWSSSCPSITFRRGSPRSQGGISWRHHQPVLANGGIIEVASISLDDFVARGGPIPHVIKVDAEGSESEVLKGAANILRNHQPILIAEVHTADEYAAVTQVLQNAAYTALWDIPPEGFPRQCFALPRNPSSRVIAGLCILRRVHR
jgi:FkbM family methyltransferase